jgi:hypothetical protein
VEHVELVTRRCASDAGRLWRCRALGCDRSVTGGNDSVLTCLQRGLWA